MAWFPGLMGTGSGFNGFSWIQCSGHRGHPCIATVCLRKTHLVLGHHPIFCTEFPVFMEVVQHDWHQIQLLTSKSYRACESIEDVHLIRLSQRWILLVDLCKRKLNLYLSGYGHHSSIVPSPEWWSNQLCHDRRAELARLMFTTLVLYKLDLYVNCAAAEGDQKCVDGFIFSGWTALWRLLVGGSGWEPFGVP